MNKQIRFFSAFLALTLTILACSFPPLASTETIGTPTPEPSTVPSDLLPRTFYYRSTDGAGLPQVFRLERDGTTRHQLTSEPVTVDDFGVSQVDGSVAYVANNQLLLVNADGSDRRVLVDGGPIDENNPFLTVITSPVFSPDGQTLAYGYQGLNLFDLSTGASNLVIENQIRDSGAGFLFPEELYWPERYSPDGSRLLITLGYYEGASAAVYDPATGELVRLQGGEGALICCEEMKWAADGASFHSASPTTGMFNSGLWKVDAATGVVTTLLLGEAGDGTFNFADEPYLAPDGQLYFFFANLSPPQDVFGGRMPLQLVRSAPDGVTGRTVLRSETFELMNEALWAPDAGLVVVAFAPNQDVYQGGRAEIVYVDGRPNVVLAEFAQQMRWGP